MDFWSWAVNLGAPTGCSESGPAANIAALADRYIADAWPSRFLRPQDGGKRSLVERLRVALPGRKPSYTADRVRVIRYVGSDPWN